MSGRGGIGIGIIGSFNDHDTQNSETSEEDDPVEQSLDEAEENLSCPICYQPMNLSAEEAQYKAKLCDQCDNCCCGACGQRKKFPGSECC
tara:strand:- start:154 stop:423 length:270 start_codon:yes stop_codon:yes gene_type:complete